MLTETAVAQAAREAGITPLSFVMWPLGSTDGNRIEIDAGMSLYPASMIKTPLAAACYALAAKGELSLQSGHEVTDANMTANDAVSPLVPGYRCPLDQLIELAITRSDNVATNMLFDIAGRDRATKIVQDELRLPNTAFHRKLSGSLPLINDPLWDRIHRNTHPAVDAARLFELIALDRVPYARELRETLARQQWNDKLPVGLLGNDRFAHKTGDTDEVTHDGGILETEQGDEYVLVVYTGMESNEINNKKFAAIMRSIRAHLR